jgi:N-acetylglucosaminyl-diphospho-decaprenol L-rhamnosyltransferase
MAVAAEIFSKALLSSEGARQSFMDLSIISVNWNAVAYLRECIASVYEQTHGVSFEIIVVDNASPQGGVEALKEQFPEIKIVHSQKNLGFAGANNLGFRESSGRYALFLNPDTKLISPAVNIMLDQLKSLPDGGIVGCKLLNTDLSVQITSIQKFPTIVNQVLDLEYLQLRWPGCPLWSIGPLFSNETGPISVEVITGACMLLRREVFEAVGMFTEDYFMYAEDIDLNHKVKKAGFTNYYVGSASIVHHGGGSSRQEVGHWATVMKYRAMGKLFQKTKGHVYGFLYRATTAFAAMGRLLILGLTYPVADVVWNKRSFQVAMRKWAVILKWALGWQILAL